MMGICVKNNILLKAILLNCFYLLAVLLLFKPFFSIDDFLMSNIVYGLYGDNYDYHVTYMNFAYGRLMVFLLRLLPKVPWYTVLFYIWIFAALTLLAYVILKWNDTFAGMTIVNVLLLFLSYEGYIAIQFTKVAGIIGSVAIFTLASEKEHSRSSRIVAAGLWIVACMIRHDCAKMVLGAWCVVLFAEFVLLVWREKKICWKPSVKKWRWLLCVVCIYVLVPKLSNLGMSAEERDYWSLYWKNNDVRVSVQDYMYPSYTENQEIYDTIGVSPNDLYLYNSWNWDCNVITLEKGRIIQALQENNTTGLQTLLQNYQVKETTEQGNGGPDGNKSSLNSYVSTIKALLSNVFSIKNIQSFFKLFPKSFLKIDVCTVYFLIMVIAVCCSKGKFNDLAEAVIVSAGILLFLMYYLYINGRYLQHRVDVGVVITAIAVFLYFFIQKGIQVPCRAEAGIKVMYLIPLLILCGTYFYYNDDCQNVSDDRIEYNAEFFEQTADSENSYFVVKERSTGSEMFVSYGVFDRPSVGMLKNIVRTFIMDTLEKDWTFTDVIDNKNMYLVLEGGDTNEGAWKTYFSEHSGSNVQLSLVKQYLNKKVYRVHSETLNESITLPDTFVTGSINGQINYTISDDQMHISGTAYLEGQSGFDQNTYIQIVDKETGEYVLYDTLAVCDGTKKYGDEGYFAWITASISVPEFYSSYDNVYLILEQKGTYYRKQLVKNRDRLNRRGL